MARNKILTMTFRNKDDMDLARVLLNSNVFYWYWRSFGDGFLLGVDVVGAFPVLSKYDEGYKDLAHKLDSALDECTTFKMYRGEKIPSYNFNKRMDLLIEIDEWIVKQVAPNLNLPRDIFAQSKSNSFMRKLDTAALLTAEEPEGDE